MKIVTFSDPHGQHDRLILPGGDVLICAGDISPNGKRKDVIDFFDWFSEQPHKYKICIAGNHDFFFDTNHERNPNMFPYNPLDIIPDNVIYLENNSVEIEGVKIWGSPMTPWFFNWAFNLVETELQTFWKQIPLDIDIIVTHGPAYGFGDKVKRDGKMVGCKHLLETIKNIEPKAHICGHIHEGYGEYLSRDGKTLMLNSSILDENYQLVNKPIVFNI